MATGITASPLAAAYAEADCETLFRKMGAMEAAGYDWSAAIPTIAAPPLLIFADGDAVTPEHIVVFWKGLGGGQRDAGFDGAQRPPHRLAILPGSTHHDLLATPAVAAVVESFVAPT